MTLPLAPLITVTLEDQFQPSGMRVPGTLCDCHEKKKDVKNKLARRKYKPHRKRSIMRKGQHNSKEKANKGISTRKNQDNVII